MGFVPVTELKKKYGYKDSSAVRKFIRDRGIAHNHDGHKGAMLVDEEEFSKSILDRQPNQHISFPDFALKDWTDHWELSGDWLITADWHLPFYNRELAEKIIPLCKKHGITKHLIVGDFFDELAFSKFVDYERLTWAEEKGYAREVGEILFAEFNETRFLMGNHDNRLFKLMMGKGDPMTVWEEVFLKAANDKWVSLYNHCFLTSGGRRWFITHPDSGGITPAWLKRRKEKYPDCSIMGAHSHKYMNIQDGSADYRLVALPGMQDNLKIGWKQRRDDTDYLWSMGFAIIRDGIHHVFDTNWTDWEWELR